MTLTPLSAIAGEGGPPTTITINGPASSAAPVVPAGLTTLNRFPGGKKGYFPRGGVGFDSKGDLYGTTHYDGVCSTCGLLYVLKPAKAGNAVWTFTALHFFGKTLQDGIGPTAPLALHNNVFYSTTSAGADPRCGCGEVFKFTPPATGHPNGTYTILHHFTSMKTGSTPIGGVLIDTDGTMYGTTSAGGKHNSGIIFKLGANGSGFTAMHDFAGDFTSGPQGEMIFGKDGAIYGTTFGGGKYNQGTIFRITKGGAFTTLYDFLGVNQPGNSTDGADPEGRLALGKDGTIYGTTTFGGTPSGYGTAWSFKPITKGGKTAGPYQQIHIFGSPGNLPHSGFVMDSQGVLYGTGAGGGRFQSGVVYKLSPPKSGKKWDYTLLYSFKGRDKNGDTPYGDMVLRGGALYGSNLSGGVVTNEGDCINGCGTVFRFKL